MMEHIRQPEGTSLCGQCVVAMLTHQPLADVIAFMGEGRTYPANLRKAAKHFGVSIPSRSTPGTVAAPKETWGAAMIWGKKQHWVAWEDGLWLDPAALCWIESLEHYNADAIAIYPAALLAAIGEPNTTAGQAGERG